MKVKDLFDVVYGVNLELVTLETVPDSDAAGVNFVARTAVNNGVVAKVRKIEGLEPQPGGILSCAGGGSVLSTFVQIEPFYSGRDLYTLTPKKDLTLQEKLFYCMCIKANAYRFSYGRQANKFLKDMELPDRIPRWVYQTPVAPICTKIKQKQLPPLNVNKWGEFRVEALFNYVRGTRITKEHRITGNIPLVTAGFQNHGIAGYIETDMCELYTDKITIDMFGNAFYRRYDFYCDDNILALTPKHEINIYTKLFIVVALNADKYRYSYGRQYRQKDIRQHVIKLPITAHGAPDWDYMEQYIKSLPYSDRI